MEVAWWLEWSRLVPWGRRSGHRRWGGCARGFVRYLGWGGNTAYWATIVLPSGGGPTSHPQPLLLVISPHGRNNFGWTNASYWSELPADGPFALICPEGLGRLSSGLRRATRGSVSARAAG
jgi:hypothetical protein